MTVIKRYLVFAYGNYYPLGGWDDLIGMADTEEGAIQLALNRPSHNNFYRIVDTQDLNNHILTPQDERMIRGDK